MSAYSDLILGLLLCCVLKCTGDCNYWYTKIPSGTVCNATEGMSVQLYCTVYHPCDNITLNVTWYVNNSTNESMEESTTMINDQDSQNTTTFQNGTENFEGCCFTTSNLAIFNFSQDDIGSYWCQYVANGSLLLPSQSQNISVKQNMSGTICMASSPSDPAFCAENTTMSYSRTGELTCAPPQAITTTDITMDSMPNTVTPAPTDLNNSPMLTTMFESQDITSTFTRSVLSPSITLTMTLDRITTFHSVSSTRSKSDSLLYGAIGGAFACLFLVIVVVVMCLVKLHFKYRKQEKKSISRYNRNKIFSLDSSSLGEISNPNYMNTVLHPRNKQDYDGSLNNSGILGISSSYSFSKHSTVQHPLVIGNAPSTLVGLNNDWQNNSISQCKPTLLRKPIGSKQPLTPPKACVNEDSSVTVREGEKDNEKQHKKPKPIHSKPPVPLTSRKDDKMDASVGLGKNFVEHKIESLSLHSVPPLHPVPPQHPVVSKDKKPEPVTSKPAVLPRVRKNNAVVVNDDYNESVNHEKDSLSYTHETSHMKPAQNKEPLLPPNRNNENAKVNCNKTVISCKQHSMLGSQYPMVDKAKKPGPLKSKPGTLPPVRKDSAGVGNDGGKENSSGEIRNQHYTKTLLVSDKTQEDGRRRKVVLLPPSPKDTAVLENSSGEIRNQHYTKTVLASDKTQEDGRRQKVVLLPPSPKDTPMLAKNGRNESSSAEICNPHYTKTVLVSDKKQEDGRRQKVVLLPPSPKDTTVLAKNESSSAEICNPHYTKPVLVSSKELKCEHAPCPKESAIVVNSKGKENFDELKRAVTLLPHEKPMPLLSKQPILPPSQKESTSRDVEKKKDSISLHPKPQQDPVVKTKPAPLKSKPEHLTTRQKENLIVVKDGHNDNVAKCKKDSTTFPKEPQENKLKPTKSKIPLLPPSGSDGSAIVDSDQSLGNCKKEVASSLTDQLQHSVDNNNDKPVPPNRKSSILLPRETDHEIVAIDGYDDTFVSNKKDSELAVLRSEPKLHPVESKDKEKKSKDTEKESKKTKKGDKNTKKKSKVKEKKTKDTEESKDAEKTEQPKKKQPLLPPGGSGKRADGEKEDSDKHRESVSCKKSTSSLHDVQQQAVVDNLKDKKQQVKSKQPLLPPTSRKLSGNDDLISVNNESLSQINKDMTPDTFGDDEPQYAMVSIKNKKPNPEKGKKPILPLNRENPQKKSTPMRETDTPKDEESPETQVTEERSPSPIYAEPILVKKKQQLEPSPVRTVVKAQEEPVRTASPEYAEIDDVEMHPNVEAQGKTTEEKIDHYYHSLEGPPAKETCSKRTSCSHDDTRKNREQLSHYYHVLEEPKGGKVVTGQQRLAQSKKATMTVAPSSDKSVAHKHAILRSKGKSTSDDKKQHHCHTLEVSIGADAQGNAMSKPDRLSATDDNETHHYHTLEAPPTGSKMVTDTPIIPKSINRTFKAKEIEHLYYTLEAPSSDKSAKDARNSNRHTLNATPVEDEHHYHVLDGLSSGKVTTKTQVVEDDTLSIQDKEHHYHVLEAPSSDKVTAKTQTAKDTLSDKDKENNYHVLEASSSSKVTAKTRVVKDQKLSVADKENHYHVIEAASSGKVTAKTQIAKDDTLSVADKEHHYHVLEAPSSDKVTAKTKVVKDTLSVKDKEHHYDVIEAASSGKVAAKAKVGSTPHFSVREKEYHYHVLESPSSGKISAQAQGNKEDTLSITDMEHHYHVLEAPIVSKPTTNVDTHAGSQRTIGREDVVSKEKEEHLYHILEAPKKASPKPKDNTLKSTSDEDEHIYHVLETPSVGGCLDERKKGQSSSKI